jgi:sortase A
MTTFTGEPTAHMDSSRSETDDASLLTDVENALDRIETMLADPEVHNRRRHAILAGEVLAVEGRLSELEERLDEQATSRVHSSARLHAPMEHQRQRFEDLRASVSAIIQSDPSAVSTALGIQPEASYQPNSRRLIGTALTVVGVLLVAFVLYELVVTPLVAARTQRELAGEFEKRVDTAAALASGAASTGGQAQAGFTFGDIDPERPEIPKLQGEIAADAIDELETLGFTVVRTPEPSRTFIPGLVTRTDPEAGSRLGTGEEITVYVATIAKGSPVGTLTIDRIGVSEIVVEGTGGETLMAGPGHYRDSSLPGQAGNAVVLGRRTTYGGPFNRLGELETGDVINVGTLSAEFVYRVVETKVVRPGDPDVLGQDGRNVLTLVTSNPAYRATERLVVIAELEGEPVGTGRSGTADDEPQIGDAIVLTPDELGRDRDTAAWAPALLWAELLAVALIVAALLYRRWSRWATWLLTTPAIVLFAFMLFESINRLLPSTL